MKPLGPGETGARKDSARGTGASPGAEPPRPEAPPGEAGADSGEKVTPVEFSRLNPRAAAPERMTPGSAGFDLRACLDSPIDLLPGDRQLVPTGLVVAIPPGFEGQVRPRSGLALKHGVTLANSPGTIDSDYRGPLGVLLINLGREPFRVAHGDRIAQLVIGRVAAANFVEVDSLDATSRGGGGFGHTGSR